MDIDTDFAAACVDEIALEGLDGTTLSTLWTRLENRENFRIALDDGSKRFLWNQFVRDTEIRFYCLESGRLPVLVTDRLVDKDLGLVLAQAEMSPDPYPPKIIEKGGEDMSCINTRGSSASYSTRVDVTDRVRGDNHAMTLPEVEKIWGEKLVIVASNELRYHTLIDGVCDPHHSMSPLIYAILERIGRSRQMGEITSGPGCLTEAFQMKPKDIFYILKKKLTRYGLIKRQKTNIKGTKSRSTILYHLKRFYNPIMSMMQVRLARLTEFLAQQPGQIATFPMCQDAMPETSIKKLRASIPESIRYVSFVKVAVSYAERPKLSRSHRLINAIKLIKRYKATGDDSDDDDDMEATNDEADVKELKPRMLVLERSLLRQTYDEFLRAGHSGRTTEMVRDNLGMSRNRSEKAVKTLIKIGLLKSFKRDIGRQRCGYYMCTKFAKTSEDVKLLEKKKGEFLKLLDKSPAKETSSASTKVKTTIATATDVTESSVSPVKPQKMFQTIRSINRAQVIIDAVKESKLIDDVIGLRKKIIALELAEGHQHTMDRKCFNSMLETLHASGQIRVITTILKVKDTEKQLCFVCDPSITPNDQIVKTALENTRLRHLLHKSNKNKQENSTDTDMPSPTVMKDKNDIDFRKHYAPYGWRHYGFQPKATKGMIAHMFMWYLVYGYNEGYPLPKSSNAQGRHDPNAHRDLQNEHAHNGGGSADSSKKNIDKKKGKGKRTSVLNSAAASNKDKSLDSTDKTTGTTLSDVGPDAATSIREEQILKPNKNSSYHGKFHFEEWELAACREKVLLIPEPTIYKDEVSWRRYVAPLPSYKSYPSGWCMMADIVLSMPLTFFLSIIHVPFRLPVLEVLLSDPIRQFYPVRNLPEDILKYLLYKQLYAHKFFSVMILLHYLGLVSVESSKNRTKNSMFLYLHHGGRLTDTTLSLPEYLRTRAPDGVTFASRVMMFETYRDVETFWCDMRYICLHTQLGFYKEKNRDPVDETKNREKMLFESFCYMTPETVTPTIEPIGDGRGACGYDSNLFMHISRNWVVDAKRLVNKVAGFGYPSLTVPKTQRLPSLDVKSRFNILGSQSGTLPLDIKENQLLPARGGKGMKRQLEQTILEEKREKRAKELLERQAHLIRQAQHKKNLKKYNHDRDLEAKHFSNKERVVWSSQEDYVLVLTKVTNNFLTKFRHHMLINWGVVRDMLQSKFSYSKDKSSKACGRRLKFIMRNSQTLSTIDAFHAELVQDQYLVSKYKQRDYIRDQNGLHKNTERAFLEVLDYVIAKFQSGRYQSKFELPSSFADLHSLYTVTVIGGEKLEDEIVDVESVSAIERSVLENIIHSYLSTQDKQSRAHEMYKTLSNYTEQDLAKVTLMMNNRSLITRIKKDLRKPKTTAACSIQTQRYHLTNRYYYMFTTWYHTLVAEESRSFLEQLCHNLSADDTLMPLDSSIMGGHLAATVSLLALDLIDFKIDLPENILVLSDQPRKPSWLDNKPVNGDNSNDDDSHDDDSESEGDVSGKNQVALKVKPGQASRSLLSLSRSQQLTDNGLTWVSSDVLVVHSCKVSMRLKGDNLAKFHVSQRNSVESISDITGESVKNLSESRDDIAAESSRNAKNKGILNQRIVKSGIEVLPECLVFDQKHSQAIIKNMTLVTPCKQRLPLVWKDLSTQLDDAELSLVEHVYLKISEKLEFGIKVCDISETFQNCSQVWKAVSLLVSHQLVLRVGYIEWRYVATEHAQPWICVGYKNIRGRACNKQDSVDGDQNDEESPLKSRRTSCDVGLLDADKEMEECGKATVVGDETKTVNNTNEGESKNDAGRSSGRTRGVKRRRQSSACGGSTPEISDMPPPLSTYQRVQYISRPWLKPEGLVNRVAYVRMLKAVLFFVMNQNGTSYSKIIEKFHLSLQPVCVAELLQVLEDIGAVHKTVIRCDGEASLFTQPTYHYATDDIDRPGDIFSYEASIDCVLLFGQFLKHIQ